MFKKIDAFVTKLAKKAVSKNTTIAEVKALRSAKLKEIAKNKEGIKKATVEYDKAHVAEAARVAAVKKSNADIASANDKIFTDLTKKHNINKMADVHKLQATHPEDADMIRKAFKGEATGVKESGAILTRPGVGREHSSTMYDLRANNDKLTHELINHRSKIIQKTREEIARHKKKIYIKAAAGTGITTAAAGGTLLYRKKKKARSTTQ